MRPHIAPLGDHQKAVAQVLLGRLKRLGLLGPPKARERESKEERRNAKKIMGISLRMQAQALACEGATYADAEDLAPGGGAAARSGKCYRAMRGRT